jgi:hypothetical protein
MEFVVGETQISSILKSFKTGHEVAIPGLYIHSGSCLRHGIGIVRWYLSAVLHVIFLI